MAEGKKSFTAYCDWQETFNSLPDDKAGQLIKHLMAYVNDENPETDDILIKAVFAQMKATLKRDLIKWEAKRAKNRESALKRWNKKDANECERIERNANNAVSDSDSVSVSVSEIIDKSITYSKKSFLEDFNLARTHFTGEQSNINLLHFEDEENLSIALKHFSKQQIQEGIRGLFMQKYLPQEIMRSKPKHLLKNIDTYIDAFKNKKENLYKE